jgi:hypothetical protein
MFTIKVGIKGEKALIISFYNNTFKISTITILRNILRHTQNINFN